MADRVGIRLTGIDRLQEKLGALVTARKLKAAAQAAGETIVDEMKQKPPRRSISRRSAYGVTFFSERQRRFFFWAMHNNVIEVPYRRGGRNSERIETRWRISPKANGVTIRNVASYAQHVHGKNQSRMMTKIGWRKLTPTAKRLMPQIRRAIVRQWRRIIDLD